MKSFILFTLVFTLISNAAWSQNQRITLHAPDLKTPKSISKSPLKLAQYLTEQDSSGFQKAFNIYAWIVHNIKYDVKVLRKIKRQRYSPRQTLRRKKGICYQYSDLFSTLCQNAGLSAREIIGYSRGASYRADDKFYEGDHSWNGVKLDSVWYLVDATWGSGYIQQKKSGFRKFIYGLMNRPFIFNRYKYVARPDYSYFLKSPESMIANHLPVDPTWQLVEFPVALETFESSEWSGYQYSPDSLRPNAIDSTIYQEKLDKYEFLSDFQYLKITADEANQFNPRNCNLTGLSSYQLGLSLGNTFGPGNRQISDKNAAIKWHKRSISQLKSHQGSARRTSKQIIKVSESRILHQLKRPLSAIKKSAQRDVNYANKFTSKSEKRSNSHKDQIVKLNNRIAKGFEPFQKPRLSSKSNLDKVASNQIKIMEYQKEVNALKDSSRTVMDSIEESILNKTTTQAEIQQQYKRLASRLKIHLLLIKSNIGIEALAPDMEGVDWIRRSIDSLILLRKSLQSTINQKKNTLVQSHAQILSKSQIVQKLIFENCRLSGNKECDFTLYDELHFSQMKSYSTRLELEKLLFKSLQNEALFIKNLNPIFKELRNSIDLNQRHYDLFEQLRIAAVGSKLRTSNQTTKSLIRDNQKELRKLSKEMDKLKTKSKSEQ